MKVQKSSGGLLRHTFLIVMALGFACTNPSAIAVEKMARLVEASGHISGCYDFNGEWIVWTESKRAKSTSRAQFCTFEVFRAKAGKKDREKLPIILQQGKYRDRPLPFITSTGTTLVATGTTLAAQYKNLWLVDRDAKKAIFWPGFDLRPFELFADGLIAGVEQDKGKRQLVFCKITKDRNLAGPIVLADNFVTDPSVFDNPWPRTCRKIILRSGTKIAWINGHPHTKQTDIVVGDIETGETKIVAKGAKWPNPLEIRIVNGHPLEMDGYPLEIDGLYGKWLLCHQGYLARLINIDDNRELQLPVPGRIIYFCPYGVVFQLSEVAGTQQCRLWDPVLQKRRDFLRDPTTTFFICTHRSQDGARIYLLGPYLVSYFSTKDPVTDVPPELMADTAEATKFCMEHYELEKDDTKSELTLGLMKLVKWPYPPETIPAMQLVLDSYRNSNARAHAAKRLAFSNDPAAKQILLSTLRKSVSGHTLTLLAFLCDKQDAIHIIEQQPQGGSVKHAANTLGILGNPLALEYLQKVTDAEFTTKDQQEEVRMSILNAIRYIKMRSEFEAVLKNLRSVSLD